MCNQVTEFHTNPQSSINQPEDYVDLVSRDASEDEDLISLGVQKTVRKMDQVTLQTNRLGSPFWPPVEGAIHAVGER